MSNVHELTSQDQRHELPGIYLLAGSRQFGIKPQRSIDDREWIPFTWATEFAPVGEFILRFPQHWHSDRLAEAWVGGPYNPMGIYWCQYDPRALGRT